MRIDRSRAEPQYRLYYDDVDDVYFLFRADADLEDETYIRSDYGVELDDMV